MNVLLPFFQICDTVRTCQERADAIITAAATTATAAGTGAGEGSGLEKHHKCMSCGAGMLQLQPSSTAEDVMRLAELRKEARSSLGNYMAAQVCKARSAFTEGKPCCHALVAISDCESL